MSADAADRFCDSVSKWNLESCVVSFFFQYFPKPTRAGARKRHVQGLLFCLKPPESRQRVGDKGDSPPLPLLLLLPPLPGSTHTDAKAAMSQTEGREPEEDGPRLFTCAAGGKNVSL